MKLRVSKEFQDICRRIVDENKSLAEWAEIESDDMYQTVHFAGGYSADEEEFCFSFYGEKKEEFRFQVNLNTVNEIASGKKTDIDDLRKAES